MSATVSLYGDKKTFRYRYEYETQELGEFLSDRYQFCGGRLEEVLSSRIKINQKTPLLGQSLVNGDMIEYDHFRSDEVPLSLEDIPVLYEDENLLALAKPAGVPVSPSGQYYFNSLAIFAKEAFENTELSPLHRLDLETSGVLLFGKHKTARQLYQKMFAQKGFTKEYLAVTWGHPGEGPILGEMASAKGSKIYTKLALDESAPSNSHTEILSVEPWGTFWLVRLQPISGKTNQLRVHLAHRNASIVGDKKYHPDENVYLDWFEYRDFNRLKEQLMIPRQALHCLKMSFEDPFTGETRSIQDDSSSFNSLTQPLKHL